MDYKGLINIFVIVPRPQDLRKGLKDNSQAVMHSRYEFQFYCCFLLCSLQAAQSSTPEHIISDVMTDSDNEEKLIERRPINLVRTLDIWDRDASSYNGTEEVQEQVFANGKEAVENNDRVLSSSFSQQRPFEPETFNGI